jgi:hypothetical protein
MSIPTVDSIRAQVDHELALLPIPITTEGNEALAEQRAYWLELKQLLALQPVPDLRECPTCKHIGASSAARCGYCGSLLSASTR